MLKNQITHMKMSSTLLTQLLVDGEYTNHAQYIGDPDIKPQQDLVFPFIVYQEMLAVHVLILSSSHI